MTTNGNVPSSDLVSVEGLLLERATAADYTAWRSAALQAGHIMRIAQPGGAYRDLATQKAMQSDYDARRYNKPPWFLNAPPSPRPANPGSSRHGFGRAVDIANAIGPGTFRDWVRKTAATYGFHLWTTTDPNHFEHGNALTAAAADVKPINNTEAIMPEVLIHVNDTSGKTVKSGEYYYHRDGVTPIVGPLSGGDPTKAGGIYWLNTVAGVPIKDVGGATFEFYQADQAKRVLAGGTVNVTNPPVDISGLATGAEVAALDVKVSAIHVPTKGTVELA